MSQGVALSRSLSAFMPDRAQPGSGAATTAVLGNVKETFFTLNVESSGETPSPGYPGCRVLWGGRERNPPLPDNTATPL